MDKKIEIDDVDYLLACSDRVRFFNEKNLIDLKIKWQNFYLWKFFNEYPILDKNYYNHKKIILLRNDFRRLLRILLNRNDSTLKEKISWIIFAIRPNIYYKLIK